MNEEKKKFNKQQYDNNYIKDHCDRINFVMPKGTKDRIKEAAQLNKQKPSEFIRDAIEEKIEKVMNEARKI